MNVSFSGEKATITGLKEFHPAHIFENGQAFRFADAGGGVYEGVAHGRFLRVSTEGGAAVLFPCRRRDFEEVWEDYFDLKRDYAGLFRGCKDAALEEGRAHAPRLRVLRQEPFEALVSYIVSANNNLKRIRSIVRNLCAACGEPFLFEGSAHYKFPVPARLAALDEERLLACGCGYRAPYIRKTARIIADGYDLEALRRMPYERAKSELTRFPGVGPKVADCVLLFACGKTDAFPADVWVKRFLKELYGFEGGHKEIHDFAAKKFGEYAGIAQQYLFYYFRERHTQRLKQSR